MNQPIFVVGDRVRLCPLNSLDLANATGTVTMVFRSAQGYYDVKFDATLGPRVCYADDMEHSIASPTPSTALSL